MVTAAAPSEPARSLAAELLAVLISRHVTLATAESLTGGLLSAAIVDVPGASAVFRGGVVTYATEAKASVLGVDNALLRAKGPVDPAVAASMARRCQDLFHTDMGIATTGVAGPGPSGGVPAGTAYIAVYVGDTGQTRLLHAMGDRAEVRQHVVDQALQLALDVLHSL